MPSNVIAKIGLVRKVSGLLVLGFFAFVLVLVGLGSLLLRGESGCGTYRSDSIVSINGSEFKAEKASSESARELGLSGRRCINPNQVMLFEFDHPGKYCFWMKDMKFDIDMLWLNSQMQIVDLEKNVPFGSFPKSFCPNGEDTKYVLELHSGIADQISTSLGQQVSFR